LNFHLCQGIALNRSITHLHLMNIWGPIDKFLSILSPIFEHNNIVCLRMVEWDEDEANHNNSVLISEAIATTLSKFNSLRTFDLNGANGFDEDKSASILRELWKHRNLSELDLSFNQLKKKGCIELGDVLKICQVKRLKIFDCDIDDECATILVDALQKNNILRELIIDSQELGNDEAYALGIGETKQEDRSYFITAEGWGQFFSLINSHSLEYLSLYGSNVGQVGSLVLADALRNNSTLKVLDLGKNTRTNPVLGGRTEWPEIFTSLQTMSVLEKLDIHWASDVTDSDLAILLKVVRNGTLKELRFDACHADGYFPDKVVSPRGLQAVARMVECDSCKLERLYIRRNYTNDDLLVDFAQALTNNACLKVLCIGDTDDDSIKIGHKGVTVRGVGALTTSLRDVSSIDNTYRSNHTLEELNPMWQSETRSRHDIRLTKLLEINKNNSISDAAREKILRYHFTTREDGTLSNGMQVVSEMDWVVLPQVIAWAGRKHDNKGCTILYQLLRCIPELVEDQTLTKTVVGEKRKLT